jgi:predicted lipoprotein with Yx(FWY)xxD motif
MRTHWIRVLPLVGIIAVGGAGAAMAVRTATQSSAGTVKTVHSTKFGTILVAANGHTLYRFMTDHKGKSSCTTGACASFWPALLVKAGTKPTAGSGVTASQLGTIPAAHGMAQVTFGGFPLYYFKPDTKAGQTGGEGKVGLWYVVNTHGQPVKHAVKTGGGGGGGWA